MNMYKLQYFNLLNKPRELNECIELYFIVIPIYIYALFLILSRAVE